MIQPEHLPDVGEEVEFTCIDQPYAYGTITGVYGPGNTEVGGHEFRNFHKIRWERHAGPEELHWDIIGSECS